MTEAFLDGRPSTADEAVEAAARLLSAARFPLVFGLVGSTVEAQREAVRIGELLGGCVDSAASPDHAGSARALEQLGLLTASLGEMRRADLIVFWGTDPDTAQPGFVARYAPPREGLVRLAVDMNGARGPGEVEERVALPAGREVESLLVLRAFVRGRRVDVERGPGLPLDVLKALAGRLAGCRYGIIIYDADPPASDREPERAPALTALVRDARAKSRMRLLGIRPPGNPVGAESVLAWRTGFRGAVSLAGGRPRYGPGELNAESLLRRGDVDAALVVGADPATHLCPEARSGLARIPTVRLGAPGAGTEAVFIATAPLAHTAGTVFRMDGIAVPHAAAETSLLPSEASVLSRIARAIGHRGGLA